MNKFFTLVSVSLLAGCAADPNIVRPDLSKEDYGICMKTKYDKTVDEWYSAGYCGASDCIGPDGLDLTDLSIKLCGYEPRVGYEDGIMEAAREGDTSEWASKTIRSYPPSDPIHGIYTRAKAENAIRQQQQHESGDFCTRVANLAESTMKMKQFGFSEDQLMRIQESIDTVEPVHRLAIQMTREAYSYDRGQYETAAWREREDFGDRWYRRCQSAENSLSF